MVKTILLNEFSTEELKSHFDMVQRIQNKFNPESFDPDETPEDWKKEWYKFYEAYKNKSFEQYSIFFDEVSVGWIGFMLDSRSASFNFDSDHDVIPADILKIMLGKVYEYMQKHDIKDMYHWTFESRKIAALKSIEAEIQEEMINTRILRSEMSKDFYNSIVSKTNTTGYRLMFCEELPEELYDNFTNLMYDILEDYRSLNPVKQNRKRMEKEDWKLRDNSEKLTGAKMQMYMLMTPENEIAAYCSLYVDKNNKETIRHCGGFTAVARAHRGKGSARYLKAKMYLKLLEENSDFTNIETDTMPWNTHMYRINEDFGFKPFKYGYEFKLTSDFIKNYLNL
ncbi:MAG: GNAT family N-acetyltransferase [Ignavibacteria bacterium]|nr:GNAT family N-acetyltransferase [Ignavibacteria bacterium]